jgi:hypothetical protein
MTKRAGAALFLAMAALFLIANRAAYKGYFRDDDLNNISWTRDIPALEYAQAILTPKLFTNNFRPAGHYYYREMSLLYGLDFPKYLPILHLAHILNVWAVWMLARRLGLSPLGASLGTLFFAFNMAVFEVYWKPMYVFDLFCATFSLGSILFYTQRRYVLSFCAFWLAYKSKELAVMLPAVLACYEFWLAEKKNWKALIPFFAVSLSFGLQGVLLNKNTDNDYAFHFTAAALWTTLSFYSSKILLVPHAGLALIALPLVVRDRRLWFGAAMVFLFFIPLLFLPGRLFSAYCYLPLAGVALMAATVAGLPRLAPVVALLCVLWIPWNLSLLRKNRRETLAADDEVRTYVSALVNFSRKSKATRVFVYDGQPPGFHSWGAEGVLRFLYGHPNPALYSIEDKEAPEALKLDDVALLKWNPDERRLAVLSSKTQAAYVEMERRPPSWQLGEGWFTQDNGFRWIRPHASARLSLPEGARDFELIVNVPPDQIREAGPIDVSVALNGAGIGRRQLTGNGIQSLRWPVNLQTSGQVNVDFAITPEYRPSNGDSRVLGVAVVAFGFR